MKKIFLFIIFMTFVFTLVIPVWAQEKSPASAAQIVFRVTSHNPEAATENQTVKWFGNRVTELTKGQVQFKYFFGGALAKATEGLDAVKSGLADMGIVGTIYHPAEFIANNMFYAVPFCPSDPRLYQDIVWKAYEQIPALTREFTKFNQKPLIPITTDSYEINTIKPVRTLENLKGLKLGVIGIYLPKWSAAVGVIPVTVPMAERFTAMQTKMIDGQILALDYVYRLKFYELAPNITIAGLGPATWATVSINLDAWNRLPPDIQKTFAIVAKEAGQWLGDFLKRSVEESINDMKAKKVNIFTLSEEDQRKWTYALPDSPAEWTKAAEAKGVPGFDILKQFKMIGEQAGYKWPLEFGTR